MTSWHPSRAVLLAVAVSVIGVSGCGSGGGPGSSTAPPAAGGFIAQLEASCRADVAAMRAAPKTVGGEAPAERRFIQKLRGLTPTAKLRPVYSQYVSLLEQNLTAFERHDVATSRHLETRIAVIVTKLRAAGATSC